MGSRVFSVTRETTLPSVMTHVSTLISICIQNSYMTASQVPHTRLEMITAEEDQMVAVIVLVMDHLGFKQFYSQ